ncbi:glycosyltransferase family 4 protein [Polaribacter pectinis]|uniref:Glycosyltransferase family 4 protein n=1 Tax=Polaribacter pectinis TaxID=2738844 RepID=A0A7G9L6L5_9FLAO|nr:glycosyltransferase family 4 protein [Polaribacter pectinis]QNM84264.1 glycosyltransferase family 4 protein [Polaribacter pectinis]
MNKKLHILFLCGWYPSRVYPNNGDFIQRHAEAVALKHKISILHIVSDENCSDTIEITSEEINGIETHIAYIKNTSNVILKLTLFWKAYFKLLKKIKPFDFVHLNEIYPFGIFALHLKWFQKKPFIISEHWTGYHFLLSKKINFLEKIISRKIAKEASFLCPVSNSLKEQMESLNIKGNYNVVPNVIDTSLFIPSNSKEKNYTIIHVSNLLDKQKNISGMLRVVKQLEKNIDNFTWKFIGGSKEKYQPLIDKLNFSTAKIEFINHISHNKLITHLQSSNLFVSFSNYETFGVVMVEAISCGVPVISTNTGILNELKLTDYCRIIPIKDEEKLLNEVLTMYNLNKTIDKEEMHAFVAKNYKKEIIANQFSELYFKALNFNS